MCTTHPVTHQISGCRCETEWAGTTLRFAFLLRKTSPLWIQWPWFMSRAEAAIAVSVLLDGIQLEFAMSRAQVRTKWADPSHVLNETQESSGHLFRHINELQMHSLSWLSPSSLPLTPWISGLLLCQHHLQ